jgi:glycosyltransferase involved in cell wall biosynthesis
VATTIGAIPELIANGRTGTLIPPGDVTALTRALLTYAQSPPLRRTHGLAARAQVIERFHIEHCATAYLALFEELSTGFAGSTHHPG